MIRVNLADGTVQVGGKFDSALAFVKGFKGRSFDEATRTWTIPTTIKEFQKLSTFPTDILSGDGSGRYTTGNHVTQYGNAYTRDEWNMAHEADAAEHDARLPFFNKRHELDEELRANLATLGIEGNAADFVIRYALELEWHEEEGRIKFSSGERREAVLALVNGWYYEEWKALHDAEDSAADAAREAVYARYDFE